MALIHEDVFVENILDDPDELEQVEDGEIFREREGEDVENDEPENENKTEEATAALKKKRKTSQKPRLNVLRLMSEKNGLMSAIKFFENVKLKGKGYELDNLNMIMRKLEIWAHQLYPSMQFDDCLAQLEKLGNTRPVATYVTKIRLGLEDVESKTEDNIEGDDDSGDEVQNKSTDNDFDRLINTQNRQTSSQADNASSVSLDLTAEQRERMLRNRLIAEQRRLARMKARQEQQLAKESSDIKNSEPTVEVLTDTVEVLTDTVPTKVSDNLKESSDIKNSEPTVEVLTDTVPAKVNDDFVAIDSKSVEVNDAVDKDIPMDTLDDNSKVRESNAEVPVINEADQSFDKGHDNHLEIQDGNIKNPALLKEIPVGSEDMEL